MNQETKERKEEKTTAPTSAIDGLQGVVEDVINTTSTILVQMNATVWTIVRIGVKRLQGR